MSSFMHKARKILEQPVCDSCLGRQFAQLVSGLTNSERGRIVRTIVAMSIDHEKAAEEDKKLDLSNFVHMKFHNLHVDRHEPKACSICGGLFAAELDKWAEKVKAAASGYEFRTFLIGTRLSSQLLDSEERLWERAGIDWVEPIKSELNREIGKRVEKILKVKFDQKNPEAVIMANFDSGKAEVQSNPLFIYGEYQKLVRGIPQTKWPSGKYKTSVEQIIAKPYMKATAGKEHKLHGLGREDIDARCLAWRPFVLEILEPKKRFIDIKALAKKIEKKVRVQGIRLSNIQEVREIKEAKLDKSYRGIVVCKGRILPQELGKLNQLTGAIINQRTPKRVMHRRGDLLRKRKVVQVRFKPKGAKQFVFEVTGEAGLYVKELVSGDSGRTQLSVSELLANECVLKDLDVIKIHKK